MSLDTFDGHTGEIIQHLITVSGWLVAFVFAIKQQRSGLKDSTRLEIYKELWPYQSQILKVGQEFVAACSVHEAHINIMSGSELKEFLIERRVQIAEKTDEYSSAIRSLQRIHDQWVEVIGVTGWVEHLMNGALENVTELGVDMVNDFGNLIQGDQVTRLNVVELNLTMYRERANNAYNNLNSISDSYFREVKKKLLKPIV